MPPQPPYPGQPYPPPGYAVQQMQTQPAKQLNWVVTLVVSILVGSFGVDRFMMGQVGLGILKLLTLGGCGVWWLIDVILIATKHQFEGIQWVST